MAVKVEKGMIIRLGNGTILSAILIGALFGIASPRLKSDTAKATNQIEIQPSSPHDDWLQRIQAGYL